MLLRVVLMMFIVPGDAFVWLLPAGSAGAAVTLLVIMVASGQGGMPGFKKYMDDQQIAAVVNYVRTHFGLGSVFAASIVGLAGALIPYLNKKSNYLSHIPPAIYCGSFVGMSGPKVAGDIYFILAASICTAVLLIISKSLLNGIGGKLGTLAFAGVAITYLILFLFSR